MVFGEHFREIWFRFLLWGLSYLWGCKIWVNKTFVITTALLLTSSTCAGYNCSLMNILMIASVFKFMVEFILSHAAVCCCIIACRFQGSLLCTWWVAMSSSSLVSKHKNHLHQQYLPWMRLNWRWSMLLKFEILIKVIKVMFLKD